MDPGKIIGHYRILRPLGKGGMGEVFLADDLDLKRRVALKILPEVVRRDTMRLARFRTEAEAAAKLNHPNIAHVYSIEEADGLQFITMEYIEGKPLNDHIAHDGLTVDRFLDWFVPLSDALCHAHERGITHRDLKPANIMIREDGVAKILDFGLARITQPDPDATPADALQETETETTPEAGAAADSQETTRTMKEEDLPNLTQQGMVMGTAAYMSPEQAEGERVDARTDIFSFGVVMYEAITGNRPFKGKSYLSLVSSILKEEPSSIFSIKPDIPYLISRTITNSLQKPLERRYQSIREVRRELEDLQKDIADGTVVLKTGGDDAQHAETVTEPVVSSWRKPRVIGILAAVVLIIASSSWFTALHMNPLPGPPLRKFQMPVPGLRDVPVISPDGTMIAYVRGRRLWIQDAASNPW